MPTDDPDALLKKVASVDSLTDKLLGGGFLSARDLTGEAADAPPPPARLGRYTLGETLGSGAFGDVFRAHDGVMDRTVALKRLRLSRGLDPRARARFQQEALALAALRLDGIPLVYDAGWEDGQGFVAMELVEGRPLDEVLAGAPPLVERVRMIEQVARIVHGAHTRGFVHRDLKPSNVVIGPDGLPRVVDFGIARLIEAPGGLTLSGEMVGTADYMSPEQAEGRSRDADARSDVFSLGAILYEALSGRRPFERSSLLEVIVAVVSQAPPPLRELDPRLPEALARAAERALEKDPARRTPTALALADELRAWRQTPAAAPRRRVAPLLVVGVLSLVAALLALRSPSSPPPPAPAVAPATAPAPIAAPMATASLETRLRDLDDAVRSRVAGGDAAAAEAALDAALERAGADGR